MATKVKSSSAAVATAVKPSVVKPAAKVERKGKPPEPLVQTAVVFPRSLIISTIFAEARWGDNYAGPGEPELALGTSSTSLSVGQLMWDPNGQDSGKCPAQLDILGPNRKMTWQVNGTPVNHMAGGFNKISQVEVVAGAIDAMADWENLTVTFTGGNNVPPFMFVNSLGPGVNTIGNGGAQSVVQITPPTNRIYTKLRLTGDVHLGVNPAGWPGPGDVFVQVFVYVTM